MGMVVKAKVGELVEEVSKVFQAGEEGVECCGSKSLWEEDVLGVVSLCV